jgi:hypothetical protein
MSTLTLFWLVLRMMVSVVPSPEPLYRHGQLATEIALVSVREPLYRGEDAEVRTAALLVAVAFRESGLRVDVTGDGGHSRCAFQIYDGAPELLTDAELCVRTGHRMLRDSIRLDRSHPVAFYARGPRYKSEEARRLSDDRVRLAETLYTLARGDR